MGEQGQERVLRSRAMADTSVLHPGDTFLSSRSLLAVYSPWSWRLWASALSTEALGLLPSVLLALASKPLADCLLCMKPSPCPAPMGPAVTCPLGHSLDSTFLLLRTYSVITHSRTHSSRELEFSGCCCAKPCAGCLEYVSEQDRHSELSRGTVFFGPGIWHVFLPLSFSGQGCDQVARDSLMAGRGPCSFLAIRPVRTLNSNPVPSRRPRVHTSEKPATADINQRAPKCLARSLGDAGGDRRPVYFLL